MIEAVIFDLGGVVLENPIEEFHRELEKLIGLAPHELDPWTEDPVKQELQIGKCSVQDVAREIEARFCLETELLPLWRETYSRVMSVDEEVVCLVKELKQHCRVALISNTTDVHAEINEERGLYDLFSPAVVSYREGCAKPDKRIFEIALDRMNIEANECVFIDDREEHLDTPKALGFCVVHYTGRDRLVEALHGLGVI